MTHIKDQKMVGPEITKRGGSYVKKLLNDPFIAHGYKNCRNIPPQKIVQKYTQEKG